LLLAYRNGIFPMPLQRDAVIAWWSPDPRAIIPLDGLRVTTSLRKSVKRFEIRVDTAFADVIAACADHRRPGAWITTEIRHAYTRMHELGWAHSVEAWNVQTGQLAGGLYGVAVGGLFAGESMFHHETDASKVALVGLVERLREGDCDGRVLDVQWQTPHLRSLGAIEIERDRYLTMVERACALTLPPAFA
jgi:leucyl/phenylalanyl-tRNA--protein transferase